MPDCMLDHVARMQGMFGLLHSDPRTLHAVEPSEA